MIFTYLIITGASILGGGWEGSRPPDFGLGGREILSLRILTLIPVLASHGFLPIWVWYFLTWPEAAYISWPPLLYFVT